ncbi:MAG TPA: phosphomannomutase/phosphoglucomutase, partial [Ktedonobacteraceae bacterium]|nr:phosphomannomutase/phosphoglucomutase [Ktedonobacteraceae bacterium]
MSTLPANVDPKIFGSYDIRGIYGQDLNEEVAYRIGRAAAQYLAVSEIAVGRDMRVSSPQLAAALIRGFTEQGINVIDLGMTTTDELYFAVGKFHYPAGVMVTASHNPGQYNGMKFCRDEAKPISLTTGLSEIRDLAIKGEFATPARQGEVTRRDVLEDYVKHALSFIDVSKIRPLKVVIDAGNGMAGMVMP